MWNPDPLTEVELCKKGENLRKWGIRLMLISLCGLALLILTALACVLLYGVDDLPYLFAVHTPILIANAFVVVGYLSLPGLIAGRITYFYGLHILTLGKIALNTKNNLTNN